MKPNILVVDDEAAVLRMTSISLAKAGYEVDTASDGTQALAMLREGAYDVLITDIHMPRMGGEDLCLAIQAEELELKPLIFVATGSTGDENRAWAESLDDIEVIEKPVSLRRLVARIGERLKSRKAVDGKIA